MPKSKSNPLDGSSRGRKHNRVSIVKNEDEIRRDFPEIREGAIKRLAAALPRRDGEGQTLPLPNTPRVQAGLDSGGTAGRKDPRRRESKRRVQSSSGSNHVSARVNTPDTAEAREERDVQTSPKARQLEEPVAREEGETYHTRRKGSHIQKEDRERRSTSRVEASTLANPEEFRVKEGTARDGYHNTRGTKVWKKSVRSSRQSNDKQHTTGVSVQPKPGGSETGKRRPQRLEGQGLEEP